jgi:hypothetical protein
MEKQGTTRADARFYRSDAGCTADLLRRETDPAAEGAESPAWRPSSA